jgi:hypothetical protein
MATGVLLTGGVCESTCNQKKEGTQWITMGEILLGAWLLDFAYMNCDLLNRAWLHGRQGEIVKILFLAIFRWRCRGNCMNIDAGGLNREVKRRRQVRSEVAMSLKTFSVSFTLSAVDNRFAAWRWSITNKQHKWIAWLATLTFIWLLQVSAGTLAAADTAAKISSVEGEQGPDFLEAAGNKIAPAPPKRILPYVLIVVGVAVVAVVLFLVVLKTDYDITGEWTMNYYVPNSSHPSTFSLMCIGDKKSGLIVSGPGDAPGDYIVDGKKVTINFRQTREDIPHRWEFIGEFTSTKRIGGDFKCYINEIHKPEYDAKFSLNKK